MANMQTPQSYEIALAEQQRAQGNTRSALIDLDTPASILLSILIDRYDAAPLEWDPVMIDLQLADDFGVEMPEENTNKINALITMLVSDVFYRSFETFHHLVNAINGAPINLEQFDPVTGEELAWALTELYINDPPEQGEEFNNRFSEEVRRYMGIILSQEGIEPQGILKVAIMPPTVGIEDDFADDPVLFEAIYANRTQKNQELADTVKERLDTITNLVAQIAYTNGKPELIVDWVKRGMPLT